MRVRAAILTLASCLCISKQSRDLNILKLLSCSHTLGPLKCLSAFGAWRARNALEIIAKPQTEFEINADLQRFPWERYTNTSDEQLYSELCDGTERLLQYRRLILDVNSDYSLQLGSNGNGSLKIDFIQNKDVSTARGSMKKLHKKIYSIIPFLILPGLIMAAILPFILPALKMMVIGVGILNNMALSGAVFTLLRNNAFSENKHRIVYANVGYHNEKHFGSPSDIHEHLATEDHIIHEDLPHNEQQFLLASNIDTKNTPIYSNAHWVDNGVIDNQGLFAYPEIRRNNGKINKETNSISS